MNLLRSPYLSPEHLEWQDTLRRWVAREITPFVNDWDEAGEFPRDLYRRAAEIGLLGLGYPEEYGGIPADRFMSMIAGRELARCGAGGVPASPLVGAMRLTDSRFEAWLARRRARS